MFINFVTISLTKSNQAVIKKTSGFEVLFNRFLILKKRKIGSKSLSFTIKNAHEIVFAYIHYHNKTCFLEH
jgi:hypothetical protein